MKKLTPDQYKGLIATVIIHVLLILLLMFLALRTPLPLPGEEGVEVNLGYNEQGFGNKQKDNPSPKTIKPVEKKQEEQKKTEKVKEAQLKPEKKIDENLTQDTEEAPAIKKKKEETKKKSKPVEKKKPVEEKKEKPKPVVNERALFKGSSKSKKQGGTEGITKGSGDQGKPHGYKESKRYKGTGGEGNGIAFSLGGRGSKYLEKPSVKVTETGTVVVSIWVNPEGKVVRAEVKQKGTTVLDTRQREIAVKAALNSIFEKDPTAPPEQRGTITYQFILLK